MIVFDDRRKKLSLTIVVKKLIATFTGRYSLTIVESRRSVTCRLTVNTQWSCIERTTLTVKQLRKPTNTRARIGARHYAAATSG